ncbi:hypothetical protein [Rossellomorea marisflavi]
METYFEVGRLEMVLKGHWYEHIANNEGIEDDMSLLEFWDSKRPYGNKDVEASIAFNLGWDYKRVLTTEYMPTLVKEEAAQLHELLGDKIKEWESNETAKRVL